MKITYEIDGIKCNEYDEEDPILSKNIAEDLINHVKNFNLPDIETKLEVSHLIEDDQIEKFINLIDENIGNLYELHKGEDWKEEKEVELTEPGLIFAWFEQENDLVGYLCFKLCFDDDENLVLYLYEIHVSKTYQGNGLGKLLICQFHELVKNLKNSDNTLYQQIYGSSLTVFSDNLRALNWYKSLDYKLITNSPVDKTLRNGKIIKPQYYLMTKPI
ncbi:unnamed protein product [Candida verbasci]|uniref:N-alpha-acetyltransferase 40 n=1 Tax=Candida verbasci TaxID=1227364 RepID=A0A9W4TZK7_9ASCO|nr:unnamed protein product [Candida verbasci]